MDGTHEFTARAIPGAAPPLLRRSALIDGGWSAADEGDVLPVLDPATEFEDLLHPHPLPEAVAAEA